MLAVSISSGQGTDYHYDEGDDGHVYSAIIVLEPSRYLHLPEPEMGPKVLTLWIDKLFMQFAQPSAEVDCFLATTLVDGKGKAKTD
ncbi:hypothetical protein HBH98_172310 [Parastagonospora nodorum]|nr:hypothetical protein HBH43_153930 [Parastagonospora nodorum]KAH4293922.1 hypothetical protein HBI01_169950 [Parastagonospora nodorum]KAH4296610.1 hypothetical protein HBI02_168780 [Parastagonospora nodorum]KAH4325094.1 hypothetical protein HBI00_160570 [Parastagonospora nodorum]KAH4341976.1 hypothetical protein HBH98_172310 [Parastagonospora nodorum]